MLEQEGVTFGTAIPEATVLRRLSTAGSRLDAEGLAELLSECREWAAADADPGRFKQALQNLTVPLSDGQRVTLGRIVQRVGGRLRGGLGGWIVPLDRIAEALRAELEHLDFPRKFPNTTTGDQALDYIREVWARACSSPEPLANEVRDVLPTAYAYCLEDCAGDASLLERWRAAVSKAAVFADREWVVVTEADDIYFDDMEDRRFFPSGDQLRTVTGGHLGRDRSERIRTAQAIGLRLLSSSVTTKWLGEDKTLPVARDWGSRFDLICGLLSQVRKREPMKADGTRTASKKRPELIRARELTLTVGIGNGDAKRVPINARLHKDTLTVAGYPVEFGSDAAKELLHALSFGQRADLAADLTGMLGAIDNRGYFNLAADKFRRSHAPDFKLPAEFRPVPEEAEISSSGDKAPLCPGTDRPPTGDGAVMDVATGQGGISDAYGRRKSDSPDDATSGDTKVGPNKKSRGAQSGSTGDSYTRNNALARQNALAKQLKASLKGEIIVSNEGSDTDNAETSDSDSGTDLGDETYRKVAAEYEREAGREPEFGDPLQPGWDIRSTDPETGKIWLIEVKGKGRRWDGDEVVELSRAQMRKAFEATEESWYLYVVEKTDGRAYQVLPIENPVEIAAKWVLCGESWRMIAENRKCFPDPSNG